MSRFRLVLGTLASVLLLVPMLAGAAEKTEPASPVGRQIADFALRDYRGPEHRLEDYADSKLVVVAFLGTDCPLVRLYGPRLSELAERFAEDGVTFVGINSNQQDSIAAIAAYARSYDVRFPILKDPGNVIADQFGAVRTPEVFVLDGQRVVRYHGRIDDQYLVGVQKPAASRHDLAEAIEELLAGEAVSVATTEAPGCFIGRVKRPEPSGDVTYSNQIARILQNRCVECHRPNEVAPFPLTSYDEVVGWAETMREVIEQERMPPWFAHPDHGKFINDARMSDEEKELFYAWVDHGCPEGDPSNLPEPREWADGWGIEEPDEVHYMSEEPFVVPAEGVVEYQYFTVDPGWTEDKWIKAVEARPDNREVVHHIIVFTQKSPDAGALGRSGLGGYAPGMRPILYPEGVAILVPAGSKLVFQMHYTPNGREQTDRSYVGVKFADPSEVTHVVDGGMAANFALSIPPGDNHHEVKSSYRFRRDTLLFSMMPHMHLRGKSFRYEVEYPDGTREILLDVPRYDFNWQLWYVLEEPKLLPKGTRLRCTAHFDNSADNLMNPNPTETVRWGDQTWEEMMIGWFETISLAPIHGEDAAGG